MTNHFLIMNVRDVQTAAFMHQGMKTFIEQVTEEAANVVFVNPEEKSVAELHTITTENPGSVFWFTQKTFCFVSFLVSGSQAKIFSTRVTPPALIGSEPKFEVMVHFEYDIRYMTDLSYSETPALSIVNRNKTI